MIRFFQLLLVLGLLLTGGPLTAAAEEAVPTQRVGQPLVIREIYIPGAEVKPKPRRDREPPLVVRILEVKPAKDGFRYDFEVQGLEPGKHDVARYLEGNDAVPAIPIEITTPLPPGLTRPHDLDKGELPRLGGYRTKMIVLGVLWFAGLAALLLFWKKKNPAGSGATGTVQATLAERLRPLVAGAAAGTLDTAGRAHLERLVIGHWRERLPEIAALSPAEAMTQLRSHPTAAPLLLALERWLHAPAGQGGEPDLDRLLAPYRETAAKPAVAA